MANKDFDPKWWLDRIDDLRKAGMTNAQIAEKVYQTAFNAASQVCRAGRVTGPEGGVLVQVDAHIFEIEVVEHETQENS